MAGSKYCQTILTSTHEPTLTAYRDLVPLTPGAWRFFRRMRIICGGQIVEDIDYYNRVREMFHEMKPAENELTILSRVLKFMTRHFMDSTKQRLIMHANYRRVKVIR